jgi:glycosyltransferase involved in cell wall biosynthesis
MSRQPPLRQPARPPEPPAAPSESHTLRIVIITDAWHPQVNGVVRTIERTASELTAQGHECVIIGPDRFTSIPMPGYREIRLAIAPYRKLAGILDRLPREPSLIHIATEGPLGWAARRYCLKRKLPFTTAYHTKFPEYLAARLPVPLAWTYALVRRFHAPAHRVLVPTMTLYRELEQRGLTGLQLWGRGVDTELFQPRMVETGLPRPLALYVGRVAVEKNIEAFLDAPFKGSKLVVGDGPALPELKRRYPDVSFAGAKFGEELARTYASADVFAFPSRTDTFGLVLLEAMACGTPVAAYPVTGPLDLFSCTDVAALDDDLGKAMERALGIDRTACRTFAERHSWAAATEQFMAAMPMPAELGLQPAVQGNSGLLPPS